MDDYLIAFLIAAWSAFCFFIGRIFEVWKLNKERS